MEVRPQIRLNKNLPLLREAFKIEKKKCEIFYPFLWMVSILKASLRNDRKSTLGWGKTAGWIKARKKGLDCNINSTG